MNTDKAHTTAAFIVGGNAVRTRDRTNRGAVLVFAGDDLSPSKS
jgi:hypothetical protein